MQVVVQWVALVGLVQGVVWWWKVREWAEVCREDQDQVILGLLGWKVQVRWRQGLVEVALLAHLYAPWRQRRPEAEGDWDWV